MSDLSVSNYSNKGMLLAMSCQKVQKPDLLPEVKKEEPKKQPYFEVTIKWGDRLANIYKRYYKKHFGDKHRFDFDSFKILQEVIKFNNDHIEEINQEAGNSSAGKLTIYNKQKKDITDKGSHGKFYDTPLVCGEKIRLPLFTIEELESIVGETGYSAAQKK